VPPRSLVVVRAGDSSLHARWLSGRNANWDLAISYFGANRTLRFPGASYVHRFKGGKWDGLHDFFMSNPEVLEKYKFFWLPDDDIAAEGITVNGIFERMERYELELAQPALSLDSYFWHLVTLVNPYFSIRYTTMVEIMVPVISVSLLKRIFPLFATTQSGMGMDYVWHRFTSDPATKVGIFDDVSVTHTRPVGSVLRKSIERQGLRQDEMSALLARFDVTSRDYRPIAFAGRLSDGTPISSRQLCAVLQLMGWARGFSKAKWQRNEQWSVSNKHYQLFRFCLSQAIHAPQLKIIEGYEVD
jgi:hypothetical protein